MIYQTEVEGTLNGPIRTNFINFQQRQIVTDTFGQDPPSFFLNIDFCSCKQLSMHHWMTYI
jgi:hypothetical protein